MIASHPGMLRGVPRFAGSRESFLQELGGVLAGPARSARKAAGKPDGALWLVKVDFIVGAERVFSAVAGPARRAFFANVLTGSIDFQGAKEWSPT